MVSALTRMLWRDLWHMRGHILATALVVASGLATLVATRGTYESLLDAQATYYRSHRFADIFARLKRAPETLTADVRSIPGVAQVQTRIVADVSLDVPGLSEPAMGRLVSIPQRRQPMLNDLQLVQGRYVEPGASDQVIVSEVFANANHLKIGDTLGAVLHGRWKRLTIVGIGLSPEYVYEVAAGMLFPDNRRFGVLWMAREALAPAFDMDGAFNDIVLSVAPGASERSVIDALDQLIEPYGGLSAYTREDQLSHRFLTDELGEIGVMTTVLPTLFLCVASFLLYVVLARLVSTQRTEIGLLKAFGHTDARVGIHYLLLALTTVLIGVALGLPIGLVLGDYFVGIYRAYFHFPRLVYAVGPTLLLMAGGASLLAAGVGAGVAVKRAAALPPAEAMRPEPPASFRSGAMSKFTSTQGMPASLRMIVRNVLRHPVKAGLSWLGIALAIGLMVVGRFALDAVNHMMAVQFDGVQRDDVTVTYVEPRSAATIYEVSRLPGVMQAEPFRSVPVWLRHEYRQKRIEVMALPAGHELRRMLDAEQRPIALPPDGLLMTRKLGEILDVRPGDTVSMALLEGARSVHDVQVVGLVDDLIGLGAYMDADALARLLHEAGDNSGALLRVRSDLTPQLFEQLKRLPMVASVAVRSAMQDSVRQTLDRSFSFFSLILVGFACVIVVGVVYNSARIALSERGHELASLSVLGFTRREVTGLLLGEQALLILAAIPAGLLIGYGLCASLIPLFDRELFRLPLVVGKWSFVYPVLATVGAAAVSGGLVARRIRHFDLVAVLKTRE